MDRVLLHCWRWLYNSHQNILVIIWAIEFVSFGSFSLSSPLFGITFAFFLEISFLLFLLNVLICLTFPSFEMKRFGAEELGLRGSNYYVEDLIENNQRTSFSSSPPHPHPHSHSHSHSHSRSHLLVFVFIWFSSAEFDRIWVMLNYDMIGSPNPKRGIYGGDDAPTEIQVMSSAIQRMFGKSISIFWIK